MSAAGLLHGRFLCCEVGLRGEGRILKGGGMGEGLEEGGIIGSHCIYVVSFLCCFVCVLFNFENRNFVILFLKKRICQTRICHKPYRICHNKWN